MHGERRPDVTADAVRAWLAANPSATQAECAAHFACNPETIRRRVPGRKWPRKQLAQWPKGKSANSGGKPRLLPIVVEKLRGLTPAALEQLERNIKDPDGRISNQAISIALTSAWGKDMGARIPVEPDSATALDGQALIKKLEEKAIALALDGDKEMLRLVLAAKAPETWGKDAKPPGGDDDGAEPIFNLVPRGQGRKEKLVIDSDKDDDDAAP